MSKQINGRIDLGGPLGASTNGTAQKWQGGKGTFIVSGTTVTLCKLQLQDPNSNWIDVPSTTVSAASAINFDIPPGQIRVVTGAGSAAVSAWAIGRHQ